MNDIIFNSAFTVASILLYIPSLWARASFSGTDFSRNKLWGTMLYNYIFMFIHFDFVKNSQLPFIGQREESSIEWLSFFMIFAYLYALPSERNLKRWI